MHNIVESYYCYFAEMLMTTEKITIVILNLFLLFYCLKSIFYIIKVPPSETSIVELMTPDLLSFSD